MNIALDPLVLLLATAASALFVGGGALLRTREARAGDDSGEDEKALGMLPPGSTQGGTASAAAGSAALADPQSAVALIDAEQAADAWLMAGSLPVGDGGESVPATPPPGAAGAPDALSREELERSLRIAEQALAVATAQLAEAATEREVHRTDADSVRKQLERQADARAEEARRLTTELEAERRKAIERAEEARRLTTELEAERRKALELERTSQRDRSRIGEIEQELAQLRETAPKAAVPEQPGAATTSSTLESRAQAVQEMRQRLQEALSDRDTARNRAEAAERLMEGVRARSRQLAEELKNLKAQTGK